jgi:hypothetical protein
MRAHRCRRRIERTPGSVPALKGKALRGVRGSAICVQHRSLRYVALDHPAVLPIKPLVPQLVLLALVIWL